MNGKHSERQWLASGRGVVVVIIIFNALLVGTMWYSVSKVIEIEREDTVRAAIERNDNLALAFEHYVSRTIETADTAIRYLIREYERVGHMLDIGQLVAENAIDSPLFTGISLVNEHGIGYTTTALEPGQKVRRVTVADRDYFQQLKVRDNQEVQIGKPVAGRVVTDRILIPIARRFNKADGSFGGAVVAFIEPDRLTDVFEDSRLRRLDTIALVGLDGITRARLKDTKVSSGEDVSKGRLFVMQARSPSGNYYATGLLDLAPKFFSYRTVRDYQLISLIGTAEADVMADFERRRTRYLGAAGLATLTIVAFMLLLLRALAGQRRAAAVIARSQARFLATFNQAAVGIAHSGLDGRYMEVNQTLCEILGYTREEFLARRFADVAHPDDLALIHAGRDHLLADAQGSESVVRENRYLRKDGAVVWCAVSVSLVRNAAGEPDYFISIIKDVSDQKRAEEALRASERNFRELVSILPVAVYVCNAEGLIERYNQRASELWGREPLIGDSNERFCGSHRILNPDGRDLPHAECPMAQVLRSGISVTNHEIIIMRPDGSGRTVLVNAIPRYDGQGSLTGAVNCLVDITERREAERRSAELLSYVQALIEASPIAIVTYKASGACVSANVAIAGLIGANVEQARAMNFRQIESWKSTGLLVAAEEVLATGISRELEVHTVSAFGKEVWLFCRLQTFSYFGEPHLLCFFEDIHERKLAERAMAQMAAIVESSTDAIISRSLDGTILSWNRGAERMLGWTAEEAIGKSVRSLIPPEGVGKVRPLINRVKHGEHVEPVVVERLRKDGSRFHAQVVLSPIHDSEGRVSAISIIMRDISERVGMEEALRESERHMRATFDNAAVGIAHTGLDYRFLRVNDKLCEILGYPREELLAMTTRDIVYSADLPTHGVEARHMLESETLGRGFSAERRFVRKDGAVIWTRRTVSLVRDPAGSPQYFLRIIEDITARKQAEAAVFEYAEEMRRLSLRLAEVEESERRSISRELHDRIGPNLIALKLNFGIVQAQMPVDARAAMDKRFEDAQKVLDTTIAQLRNIMSDLRPPALDDYGLLAALRSYAQPYAERLGIPVNVRGDDIKPRLPIAVETALFRIVQEALNNVAKHAHARRVEIVLDADTARVRLAVADDGGGFSVASAEAAGGWGLRTMRERAQAIGALLTIESAAGDGTRITVEMARESMRLTRPASRREAA